MRAEKKNERSMNRQERRRQERLTEKQGKETPRYEMKYDLIQPWSTPVMKTTLSSNVLQTMIEISDLIIADKEAISWGEYLAGQIENELLIEHNILEQTGVMDFFMQAVRQFIIICKCQMMPDKIGTIKREEWMTHMLTMWIISQQPGEYNPMHVHADCQISAIMYLKIPKMLPSIKENQPTDGSILFTSNASRDLSFSAPGIQIIPQVGDFFIFGAQQQHAVYPYRCEEGQKDTERRSISFNAIFKSKTDYDAERK